MKTAVIYNSQTGFTERYARWIAEAVGAEAWTISAAKNRDLSAYDAIVFGGWACAGGISKLGWLKKRMGKWAGKKLIVFCVGASPLENPDIDKALRQNFTEQEWNAVQTFYCPGGLNYEKMPAASRVMMKLFVRTLRAKKEKTQTEQAMANMLAESYDISDRKYIEPILNSLRTGACGQTQNLP